MKGQAITQGIEERMCNAFPLFATVHTRSASSVDTVWCLSPLVPSAKKRVSIAGVSCRRETLKAGAKALPRRGAPALQALGSWRHCHKLDYLIVHCPSQSYSDQPSQTLRGGSPRVTTCAYTQCIAPSASTQGPKV